MVEIKGFYSELNLILSRLPLPFMFRLALELFLMIEPLMLFSKDAFP